MTRDNSPKFVAELLIDGIEIVFASLEITEPISGLLVKTDYAEDANRTEREPRSVLDLGPEERSERRRHA